MVFGLGLYHEQQLLLTNLSGVWLQLIAAKHVTTENVGVSVLAVTEAFIYHLL